MSQAEEALANLQKETKVRNFKAELGLKDLRRQLDKANSLLAESKDENIRQEASLKGSEKALAESQEQLSILTA